MTIHPEFYTLSNHSQETGLHWSKTRLQDQNLEKPCEAYEATVSIQCSWNLIRKFVPVKSLSSGKLGHIASKNILSNLLATNFFRITCWHQCLDLNFHFTMQQLCPIQFRFEMPYNIWCGGCKAHIGMGVRYNAEKSKTGNYYSTPIYKFRMKCHLCDNYFEIQTDPKVLCLHFQMVLML